MDFWEIAKKVGAGVFTAAFPAGAAVLSAVNSVLPDEHKLPEGVTGDEALERVKQMPPEMKAQIIGQHFDVELAEIKESHATLRAVFDSDAKMQHTTRPHIALGSFYVIAFTVVVTVIAWAYGVFKSDEQVVTAVMNGWPFVLGVIGPLVTLLWAYFGVLRSEHKNRLDAANGVANPNGLAGVLSAVLRR